MPVKTRVVLRRKNPRRRTKTRVVLRRKTFKRRSVGKVLGNGVSYKTKLYGENVIMNHSIIPNYQYVDMVRDIPRFLAGSTTSSNNLSQARLRNKLYIKGIKFNISMVNYDPDRIVAIRVFFFRNNSWDETLFTGNTNLVEALNGNAATPSKLITTATTERFNVNLVRNRKRDLFFDKTFYMQRYTANGGYVRKRSFYVPINQLALFESKTEASQQDDLKTGRYCLCVSLSNDNDSSGTDMAFHWDANIIYAEN